MTCREKLKIEHPECVGFCYTGGCEGCPSDYGYMDDPDYCTNRNHRGFLEHKCEQCWDRDIPGTEVQPEGKSVCELLEENRELKKQLEEKDELINKLKVDIRGYHRYQHVVEPLIFEPEDWSEDEWATICKIFGVEEAERIKVSDYTLEFYGVPRTDTYINCEEGKE